MNRKTYRFRATAIAVALLATHLAALADTEPNEKTDESSPVPAQAQTQNDIATQAAKKALDMMGITLWGYGRGGFYGAASGEPKGQYQLGGEIDHYRLGNEGDNYLEFGIGKKWQLDGAKLGTYWMPTVYNGTTGTAQLYADIGGLAFAPNLTFWAGQRYHRIQDVHILDNWLMEDGDNLGAGVDGIKLGGGTMNLSVSSSSSTNNNDVNVADAKRANVQWRDIPVSPGGTINLTAAYIRADVADKKNSGALGLLYNQKITVPGTFINSLFVQGANGHADLRGKFYNLGTSGGNSTTTTSIVCTVAENPNGTCPTAGLSLQSTTTTSPTVQQAGAKQFRIVESPNWQIGPFGGQAVLGYEQQTADDTSIKTKDFSMGGRLSYGVMRNVKLYGEAGYETRRIDNQANQSLHKETVAVAFAPNTDFWTRPEIRFYVTHAGWNSAAQAANAGTFGQNGRTNAIAYGIQVEAWWE